MRVLASVLTAVLLALPASSQTSSPAGKPPDRDELMRRVGVYIQEFVDRFANVVAAEDYTQQMSRPKRTKRLKSDFMLVRYPGADSWLAFRDVFEVDGKAVRDQQERLSKLFLEPFDDAINRARDIARASAKYNILDIGNLNNPLLALALLQNGYQPRFHYTLSGRDEKVGPGVRVVQFQEFRTPTLLKADANADLPANGLAWVEETTGRVAKTELQVGRRPFPVRIVTTFKRDEALDIDVPTQMDEWYPDGAGEVTGLATYGRFRRFEVRTEEVVTPR
jgi:hypothetical protein